MPNFINMIAYAVEARWPLMRITTAGDRLEYRLADGSVNPYFLQASVIAAALEGIDKKLRKLSATFSFLPQFLHPLIQLMAQLIDSLLWLLQRVLTF